MMNNLNPIELAKQRSEQQQRGNSSTEFFSLKDGESAILRFVTGMVPTYIVRHECGLNMVDIPQDRFNEAAAAGISVACPMCGKPLEATDIIGARQGVLCADTHNFFPTSEADKRTNFTCLASPMNARFGYVPADEHGNPLYQCPACSCMFNRNKDTGKPKMPAMRVYGVAVERTAVVETEIVGGIPTQVTKDIKDVMVESDGKLVPKLVIVNMGFNNFWSKLGNWCPDYSRCICNYDWRIARIGSSLQTSYDVQCLNGDRPTPLDPDVYAPYMPDIEGLIKGMGTPQFYVKKGYAVPGYVPPEESQGASASASSAQQAVSQAAFRQQYQPQQQFVRQDIPTAVPQVGSGNDWSVVQNQFR